MSENYIVINGKKTELTEEQLKQLGIELKRKTPFDRVDCGKGYWYVSGKGVDRINEAGDDVDSAIFDACNYFNDRAFAEQVNLRQLLYRKLLKFAYENGYEDKNPWGCDALHFCVGRVYHPSGFFVDTNLSYKCSGVYFNSREGAERAIEEVVKPFMKEHPDFVW